MAVLLAALLDASLREPPVRFHPVVWIGGLLNFLERFWRDDVRSGALAWAAGAALVLGVACLLEAGLRQLDAPLRWLGTGLLLWPAFSLRLLLDEVRAVAVSLDRDLRGARRRLARLVSRDTAELDEGQVRMAAIATLAENASDSLVAPLFYFVLFGLPGAWLYRYVNTADAVWGYLTPRYRRWGWAAARADDVLNWVPARLTGALLHGTGSWPPLRREAGRTPSPNAGWPMGAVALALGVRLEKVGGYVLNPAGRTPEPVDLRRAARRVFTLSVVVYLLAALLSMEVWRP